MDFLHISKDLKTNYTFNFNTLFDKLGRNPKNKTNMRKFFAGIMLFIILLIAPVISFIYAGLETYLSPNFYTDEVVISEIYDTLTSYVENNIENAMQTEEDSMFDPHEITDQMETILPKESLAGITEDLVAQLMQEPLPETITVDLSVIKENLPQVMNNVMTDMVYEMEECPEKTIADFDLEGGEMITCIPSGVSQEELIKGLEIENTSMFDDMPDETEIDLTVLPDKVRDVMELVIQNNTQLKAALLATYFLLVMLMALIIFKPFSSVLKWIGNAFFWSGLPLAIINLTIDGTMNTMIPRIAEETPDMSVEMIEESMATVMVLIKLLTDRVQLHGIILTAAGAVFILVGIIITCRTNDQS